MEFFGNVLAIAIRIGFELAFDSFAMFLSPSYRVSGGDYPLPDERQFRNFASKQQDIKAHIRAFFQYARCYRTADRLHSKHLRLKKWHTLRVLGHARRLALTEPAFADPLMARSLVLAALYHDIARFYQYSRYGTFSDARSCNHGETGCQELHRLGLLDAEEPIVRGRVLVAVRLHNCYRLPPDMPEDAVLVTNALRDADKLDILRIMAKNLGPGKTPDPVIVMNVTHSEDYTPAVLAAVTGGDLASFTDIVTVTDMRLLLCGWYSGLNFPTSRRLAVRNGDVRAIALSLPDTPALAAFKEKFLHALSS